MKLTQTWVWLAAGVLAAGLNASYHDGGLQWAHRVADRVEEASSMVRALASGHADVLLTEARTFLAQNAVLQSSSPSNLPQEEASCRWATTLARVQTKIARSETRFARIRVMTDREREALDRAQAEQDRVDAQRDRMEALMQANRDRLEARMAKLQIAANLMPVAFNAPEPPACPRVRVTVPQVHVPRINIPRINVPRMPVINIAAPAILIDTRGADPI
jgi:hypothetical protein